MSKTTALPVGDVPGFPCPNCRTFRIKTTLEQILHSSDVRCGGCGFALSIDRGQSQKLMTVLQDLYVAEKNVASLRRQSF